jgi:glycosyltransferase involved in cell wall biosynthesis
MRRVVYVHYVPTISGAAISLGTLLKYLDRNRYEPHLLQVHPVDGPVRGYFESCGVTCHHVPTSLVWDLPWWGGENVRSHAWRAFRPDPGVEAFLRRLQPAIVHLNDFPPLAAGLAASQLGLPVVWHSRWVLARPDSARYPARRILRTIERHARRIIGIAEPEAAQFRRTDVDTVYNPLDFTAVETATKAVREVRSELGATPDDFVVVAPIQVIEDKGAWDFINACAHARRIAPGQKLRFAIVGSIPPPGRRQLVRKWTRVLGPKPAREHAADLIRVGKLEDVFTLTGYRDNVYDYFLAADLIVFPSHLRACGRPCFEAGAFGKPILVTMPHQNTRVVLEGVTGFILPEKNPVALGEAIVRLAADRPLARRLGEAGRDHVRRHFDAQAHAGRIMEIYDEVLAAGHETIPAGARHA